MIAHIVFSLLLLITRIVFRTELGNHVATGALRNADYELDSRIGNHALANQTWGGDDLSKPMRYMVAPIISLRLAEMMAFCSA